MTKWLKRDVRELALSYILFTKEEDYRAELKKMGAPDDGPFIGGDRADATTWFLHSPDNSEHRAIVCIIPSSTINKADDYALLVHEAVHIWQEHCELIGEEHPGSEDEAYTIQYITYELIKAYDEQIVKPAFPPFTFPNKPLYPTTPAVFSAGCPACGIGANGEPMGYVCSRSDCPTQARSIS